MSLRIDLLIIIALSLALYWWFPGPMTFRCSSRYSSARVHAGLFVQAHQEWYLRSDTDCPSSLRELLEYMNSKELIDPWGRPYRMVCGRNAPEGVKFGVMSAGYDRVFGTRDDIKSWESRRKKRRRKL